MRYEVLLVCLAVVLVDVMGQEFPKEVTFHREEWWKNLMRGTEEEGKSEQEFRYGGPEGRSCRCRRGRSGLVSCWGLDCREFPKDLTPHDTSLDFGPFNVTRLTRDDLSSLKHVQVLTIRNGPLRDVDVGAFRSMIQLKNLSISFTHVQALHPQAFQGLEKLEEMFLIKNRIRKISNVTESMRAEVLPNLFRLHLGGNDIGRVWPDDFAALKMGSLRDLQLPSSNLSHIHPRAFVPFGKLGRLQLRENVIPSANLLEIVANLPESLYGFDISSIPLNTQEMTNILFALSRTNVRELWLSKTTIPTLWKGFLPKWDALERLELKQVGMLYVEDGALDGTVHLKHLTLSENKLTSIPMGILAPSLTTLDLSRNSGGKRIYSYFHIGELTFRNMSTLESLDLSRNKVLKIEKNAFMGLSSLQRLNLEESELEELSPGVFDPLSALVSLDLSRNHLVKAFPKDSSGISITFPGSLKVLKLSSCGIQSVTEENFSNLKKLTFLDLSHNKLFTLPKTAFRDMENLKVLNLSHNGLIGWHEGLLTTNAQLLYLSLRENHVTTVTREMIQDVSIGVEHLDLQGNPFACTCDLKDFAAWFLGPKSDSVKGKESLICVSPQEWEGVSLLKYAAVSLDICPSSLLQLSSSSISSHFNCFSILFIIILAFHVFPF